LILELGSGQGVATQEISDYWKPHIVALEPGTALCEIARARLKEYSKVRIINTSFESYQNFVKKFDGVFSATAFHWSGRATTSALFPEHMGRAVNYAFAKDHNLTNILTTCYFN